MTTAVKPKSGLDWSIEVPDLIEDDGAFVSPFSQVLYNVALGARFGWVNIPKRNLSLTEQALIANFRTLIDSENKIKYPNIKSPAGKAYLESLGRTLYMYIRAAIADPQVGHFVGNGSEGNNEDAELWQHSGH